MNDLLIDIVKATFSFVIIIHYNVDHQVHNSTHNTSLMEMKNWKEKCDWKVEKKCLSAFFCLSSWKSLLSGQARRLSTKIFFCRIWLWHFVLSFINLTAEWFLHKCFLPWCGFHKCQLSFPEQKLTTVAKFCVTKPRERQTDELSRQENTFLKIKIDQFNQHKEPLYRAICPTISVFLFYICTWRDGNNR